MMQSLSSPTQPRLKRRTLSSQLLSTSLSSSPASPGTEDSPTTPDDVQQKQSSLALGDISAELGARKAALGESSKRQSDAAKGSAPSPAQSAMAAYRYPSPMPTERTEEVDGINAASQLSPLGTHAHAIPPRRPSTDYHSEEDTASLSRVSFSTSHSGRYVTDQGNSFVDLLETVKPDGPQSSAADGNAGPSLYGTAGSTPPPSSSNLPSGTATPMARLGQVTAPSSPAKEEGVSLRSGPPTPTRRPTSDSNLPKPGDNLLSPPSVQRPGSSGDSAASSTTAVSVREEVAPASVAKAKLAFSPPEAKEWGAHFWCVITDPGSGQSFFANPTTGACVWEVPAGTLVLPPNPEGQWWELYDEVRHLPYFYHTQTHSSTWIRPAGFVIPLKAIQETTLGRRFSRRAFGHDSLADLAYADRRRSIKAGQSLRAEGRSRSNPSIAQRTNAPAPPTLSPSINQVLALQAQKKAATAKPKPLRTMGSRDELIAQAMASPVKARPGHPPLRSRLSQTGFGSDGHGGVKADETKEASGSKDSALRGQYPPRAASGRSRSHSQPNHVDEEDRKGWRAGQVGSSTVGAAVKAAVSRTRSKTEELSSPRRSSRDTLDRSLDLSTLSSFEISKPGGRVQEEEQRHKRPGTAPTAVGQGSKMRGPSTRGLSKLFSSSGGSAPLPTQRLSSGEHHVLPSGLASEIRQFAFEGYAARHFFPYRKGLLRRKESSKTRSRWQKEPITAPLLPIERDLHKDALSAFKVVLRVCGDRDIPAHAVLPRPVLVGYGTVPDRTPFQRQNSHASSLSLLDCPADARPNGFYGNGSSNDSGYSTANAHGEIISPTVLDEERWLLERGILGSPMMRDELYSQVLKQLGHNPSEMSTFKGWQLLCVFLVAFPPSRDFVKYVRAFLEEHAGRPVVGSSEPDQPVDPIPVMARHSLGRLEYISRRGAKGKTPSIEEIKCAQDAAFNPSVFGHTLEEVMATQSAAYPEAKVPILLIFLTEAMLAMGATDIEGVFRVAGDAELTTQLVVRIERGQYSLDGLVGEVDEEGNLVQSDVDADVAVLTSVLKTWLRELQEPLIPPHMYEDCLSASRFPHQSAKMIEQLPELNRRVVVYLLSFLQHFCSPDVVARTRMSVDNIARIWAPNFLRGEADVVERAAANSRLEHEFVAQLLLAGAPPRSLERDGRTTPTMSRPSSSGGLRPQYVGITPTASAVSASSMASPIAAAPLVSALKTIASPSATGGTSAPASSASSAVPSSSVSSSTTVAVRSMHTHGRALTPITEPTGGSSVAASTDLDARSMRSSLSFVSSSVAVAAAARAKAGSPIAGAAGVATSERSGTPLRTQVESWGGGGEEDDEEEEGEEEEEKDKGDGRASTPSPKADTTSPQAQARATMMHVPVSLASMIEDIPIHLL